MPRDTRIDVEDMDHGDPNITLKDIAAIAAKARRWTIEIAIRGKKREIEALGNVPSITDVERYSTSSHRGPGAFRRSQMISRLVDFVPR